MLTVDADIGGFSKGKKHIATLRLQSPNMLDIETFSDGTKTALEFAKMAAEKLAAINTPELIEQEWEELSRVVPKGVIVTISFGVMIKYNDPE